MTFWLFFLAGVLDGLLIWIRERLKEDDDVGELAS